MISYFTKNNVFGIDYVKHFHAIYISQTEFIQSQIRDATNIQRFVFYMDTYTLREKFLGTFTHEHVRVLIAKFYFLF